MSKKILVVDDDPIVIKLVNLLLKSKNLEVFTSSDGLDAMVKVKNEKPDLIILDIVLPEINGYDICYQLRFNEEFNNTPIILLSEREQEMDDEMLKRTNIEHVTKPIDPKTLFNKIEKFLGPLAAAE